MMLNARQAAYNGCRGRQGVGTAAAAAAAAKPLRVPPPPIAAAALRHPARPRRLPDLQRRRAVAGDDEDLMQFPDRLRWYEAKFAADDMPDWNAATLLHRTDLAPGVATLTLGIEASRERVPLRSAYVAAGQRARVRANGGVERLLPVASAPPGVTANQQALFLAKGDIFAGEMKTAREPHSMQAQVTVVATADAAPELYAAGLDDALEAGPFEGSGLDLRTGGVVAAFRFPTLVLFVSGPAGIATAAALLESPPDAAGLSPELRSDVVVYYDVPNESAACFRDRVATWAARGPVRVVVTTRGFADAFDGDEALVYDPDTTAAIILTSGDAEAEAAARAVCADAEIATIASDAAPADPPVYLAATPQSFQRWAAKQQASARGAAASGGASCDADEDAGATTEDADEGKVAFR